MCVCVGVCGVCVVFPHLATSYCDHNSKLRTWEKNINSVPDYLCWPLLEMIHYSPHYIVPFCSLCQIYSSHVIDLDNKLLITSTSQTGNISGTRPDWLVFLARKTMVTADYLVLRSLWLTNLIAWNRLIDWCGMMTSSNGNIFRVTGHLCGEFTGPGEFPTQRPVTRSLDDLFDLRLNKRLSKQSWVWWFETLSRPLWRHCNGYRLIWFGV